MSDLSDRARRLQRLRKEAEDALSSEGTQHKLSAKLWQLIEQLEAENEELQRTRDETEALHHQFAELYEHAPVGYLVLNPKFLIIQANETAREFLRPNEIYHGISALGGFLCPDCQDDYFKALRVCKETGEPRQTEICIERGEKEFLWLLARIVCDFGADGQLTRYRVTLSDITDRVVAQQHAEERRLQVERLLEEKELLVREIHHRVKNDFHIIGSFLALQRSRSESPEVKAAIEEARSRVTVMLRLYDTLHKQSQYAEVELRSLFEEIVAGFESGMGETVRIETEVEEITAPTSVSVSMGLIFNEFLTNAGKYAFQNVEAPALTVSLRRVNEGDIELTVADNGPGMPSSVVNGKSRGFGLSVAEAMAQQHRGRLTIENEGGAVVRVTLKKS